MTKKDLSDAIALKADINAELANKLVDTYHDCMVDFFKKGESVYLRGFATFEVITQKAKKGRNIKQGTIIEIPERKKIKFKKSSKWEIK